jgi:prolyl oligopeptidase
MWTPALSGLTVVALLSGMALTMNYPQTQRIEHTDDYFGVKVADPYRWLEDDVRQSPRSGIGWMPK